MFTQCSNCETVFRLSAEVLRTAGGQVRCGRCGEVFNALARLAEDANAFTVGESPLDMEALADQILQSTPPPRAEGAPHAAPEQSDDLETADVEFARLQVLDVNSDNMLEFTLPPGELDRVFVEPKAKPLPPLAKPPPAPSPAAPSPAAPTRASPTPAAATPAAATPATRPPAARAPAARAPAARASATQSKVEPGATAAAVTPPGQRIGLAVSDEVRREVLAGFNEARLPQIDVPRRRDLPRAVWVAAALLLGAGLIAQIILAHHDWSAWSFGGAAPTAANLSAYQLRQWGVTGDPGARGTLRVRASILNTAAQLQPYPLLRLTLANRFGTRIGTRDFEPAEYLGKPTVRMLAPAERADATLDILDPGKDAEGFEIDVCLRAADQKISCAADAAMQRKR